MARNITLTLGAGLGADLGPNFNLTANVGSVTPSTATKTELTAGKSVSVDDAATQVTITSTGTCTNAITQTIPCAGGTTSTTTTTAAPTTTTTTSGGITYEVYYADEYDCATCTLQNTNVQIAFPTGTSVTVGKWYAPESLNGYSYQLSSLTLQSGPGLIMLASQFNSCAFACIV